MYVQVTWHQMGGEDSQSHITSILGKRCCCSVKWEPKPLRTNGALQMPRGATGAVHHGSKSAWKRGGLHLECAGVRNEGKATTESIPGKDDHRINPSKAKPRRRKTETRKRTD